MSEICIEYDNKIEKYAFQHNGMCIDCFSEKLGEIIEKSPIVNPEFLK